MIDWLYYGVAALLATLLLTAALLPAAQPLGLVDRPGGRKDHGRPIPVIGGVAIILVTVVMACLTIEDSAALLAFVIASLLLLLVGVLDDMHDLRWFWRIGAQAAAALIMIYVGGVRVEQIGPLFGMEPMALGSLSVPFTVFATVGLINAVNMVDGIDGLAGSLVIAALLMLGCAAAYSGNDAQLPLIAILVGSLSGFLFFNLRRPGRERALTFMGNGGSAFLGFVIAWFSFRLTQNPGHPVSPVLAPFLILLPLLDCLVLIVRRLKSGRSPFTADRGHLHHRLLDAGFSQGQAVALLLGLSFAAGLAAALLLKWNLPHPFFVLGFIGLFVLHYWATACALRSERVFRWLHARLFGPYFAQSVEPAKQDSVL
ncbi:MAG: MraY family glycosyltransferase [Lysobacteraceae bacterium]